MVVVSAVLTASAALSSRRLTDAGVAPELVAWVRYAVPAVCLSGLMWRGDWRSRDRRRACVWGLACGVISATGWTAFARAVAVASVPDVAVVYASFPLFTLLALRLVFGIRPTVRQTAGAALATTGAAVALGVGADVPAFAWLAPAGFGCSIAILTERLGVLAPMERLAVVAVGAAVGLGPVVLAADAVATLPSTGAGALWLVAVGVGAALLPMALYSAAAPSIGAAASSVAGAVELPAMLVLASLFLAEPLTGANLAGTAIIVVAVVVGCRHPGAVGVRPASPSVVRSLTPTFHSSRSSHVDSRQPASHVCHRSRGRTVAVDQGSDAHGLGAARAVPPGDPARGPEPS
ncbi:MAG: DMT family transporter [Actinomycetota bacterium]